MVYKKKILQITYHGGTGGVAVMVKNLSEYLFNEGTYDVHVCFAHDGGPIADQIASMGVQTYIAGLENGLDFKGMWRIVKFIKSGKFDVVHLHYFTPILRLACILANCKCLIMTKHMSSFEDKARGRFLLLNFLHRILRSSVDIYSTVSHNMKREMLIEGIADDNKIEVIYNGVDIEKFDEKLYDKVMLRNKYELPVNGFIVGTVRGLGSDVKGVDHLIYALKKTKETVQNIHLLIVGDGPLRPALELLVEKLDLQSSVTFLGTQLNVPEMLAMMDVFLLPSKWETFGIAAAEAMAMRKPVVAYAVGGVPEVVEHEVTGILVARRDPVDFAEGILRLVSDSEVFERMGRLGQVKALSQFDNRKCMESYCELYRRGLLGVRL